MEFKLTINTDNAAFDGAINAEVARILHELATRIETANSAANYFIVVDGNGNKVGTGEFI